MTIAKRLSFVSIILALLARLSFAQGLYSANMRDDRYAKIPFDPAYGESPELTVEFWMKTDDANAGYSPVSCAQDNDSDESGFYFYNRGGKLVFTMKTPKMRGNEWNDNPGARLKAGIWYHVAGTYDGTAIRFFLDGQLAESKAVTGKPIWIYEPLGLFIGRYVDDNEDLPFRGQIADLRIWRVARTQEEVASFMRKKLSGTEKGLLSWYQLAGGGDSQVKDSGPLRNHGKMVGADDD